MKKSKIIKALVMISFIASTNAYAIGGTKQIPPTQKYSAVESIGDYWTQFWNYFGL